MHSNKSAVIPISCPLCCQTNFPSVDSLKLSLIKVTSRPLKCPLCDEIVFGLDKLTIHLFAHSFIKSNEELLEEPKRPTQELKAVRKQKASSKPDDTNAVGQKIIPQSSTSTKYFVDIKTETSLLQRENKCDICSIVFQDENLLEIHTRLVHDFVNDSEKHDKPGSDYKFRCHLCKKCFKMKGSLRIHLKVAHYGFQLKRPSSPTNVHNDNIAQSNGFFYSSGSASKNELIKISGPKSPGDNNSCEICGKNFTTKYFLKKHKRLHTGEQPYTCNICQKSFTFQQSYHKHLLYHSDEKPHVCNVCNRAFKELSTLHNHERIHSGEKPFECETCGDCSLKNQSF